MISVVVREMPYLKVLHQICVEMASRGIKYNLYLYDAPRGSKEYARASVDNVRKSSPAVLDKASKVVRFANDDQLMKQLLSDKIRKMVSVEIGLWGKIKFFVKNNIKTYSVQYLSDSMHHDVNSRLHRVFYTCGHVLNSHQRFVGTKYDPSRDKVVGSPLFDCINNNISKGSDILLLLPNIREEHVAKSFGSKQRFVSMVEKMADGNNLILKSRKKQWFPDEIKKYAKEVLYEGDVMYPTIVSSILQRTKTTVMFYSSGIYEAVYGGNYIVNIEIPSSRWSWNQKNLKEYHSKDDGNLFSHEGVVTTVTQDQLFSDTSCLNTAVNKESREKWISEFIGTELDSSSKGIVDEIINS